MLFVAIEFPRRIAFGAQAMPSWSTMVAQTAAGFESTDQRWSNARHSYDIALAIRTNTDYYAVLEHFHQVRGRAKSFPFKDFLDHRVEQAQGVTEPVEGSPANAFQLFKRYGSGDNLWDRRITRPMVDPLPAIYRTRASVTTVANADATLDYAVGVITMDNHLPGDTYTWSGQFFVPCRYDTDSLPASVPNKQGDGQLLVAVGSIPIVEVREAEA